MKKISKYILKMVVVFFIIVGLGTTVLAASGYIQWKGSSDFFEAMESLNLIEQRGTELKSERDMANATNGQLQNIINDKENIIRDKDNLINAKEQEILAKEQEIENLMSQQGESSSQLNQAEKDMKDINNKAKQVLNGLN